MYLCIKTHDMKQRGTFVGEKGRDQQEGGTREGVGRANLNNDIYNIYIYYKCIKNFTIPLFFTFKKIFKNK